MSDAKRLLDEMHTEAAIEELRRALADAVGEADASMLRLLANTWNAYERATWGDEATQIDQCTWCGETRLILMGSGRAQRARCESQMWAHWMRDPAPCISPDSPDSDFAMVGADT